MIAARDLPAAGAPQKKRWLAVLLTGVFAGAGLVYLGRSWRGVAWLVGSTLGYAMLTSGVSSQFGQIVGYAVTGVAEWDTLRTYQRVRSGDLTPEPTRLWRLGAGTFSLMAVAKAGLLVLALLAFRDLAFAPFLSEPQGTVRFAQTVAPDYQMTGQSTQFSVDEVVQFGARLHHWLPAGAWYMQELIRVDAGRETVIATVDGSMTVGGNLLRGSVRVSTVPGPGTYRVRLTSGNGVEAEGSFTATSP